jgi:hypothetical protein
VSTFSIGSGTTLLTSFWNFSIAISSIFEYRY